MRRLILSTESGADLPKELADKHNVQVVPMHVIMDGQDFLDGSLPVTDIYDYYKRTKKYPLQRPRIPMNILNFSRR
jgi:fatty acid-binding protein DegV